jgi:hypothetical protein
MAYGTDKGTVALIEHIAPGQLGRVGELVLDLACLVTEAGALEGTVDLAAAGRVLNGRIVGLEHEPLVDPTAISDVSLFDLVKDAAAGRAFIRGSVAAEGQDLVTTTHTYRLLVEADSPTVNARKVRVLVAGNSVETYHGLLRVYYVPPRLV